MYDDDPETEDDDEDEEATAGKRPKKWCRSRESNPCHAIQRLTGWKRLIDVDILVISNLKSDDYVMILCVITITEYKGAL
jgi:hypothetical protein